MAISSTENRKAYAGDGTSTIFAFPYPYQNQTDLHAKTRNGTGVGTTESNLTLTSHYTVSPTVDATAGGFVTMLLAPDSTTSLVIFRDPPQTQTLDLQNDGDLPAESIEKAFDKVTLLVQRIQEQLIRAAVLSETDTSVVMTLPYLGDRTSTFLGFDASGRFTPYLLSDLSVAAVTPFMKTLLDDPDASTARSTLGVSYPGVVSKTSSYTATIADNFINCNATTTAFTVTLYSATGNAGRTVTLKKTDGSTNAVTVLATIDGATSTTVNTQNEALSLYCDGTSFLTANRSYPQTPTPYTTTLTNFGNGTASLRYWREGRLMRIKGILIVGSSVPTAEVRFTAPSGLTADTALLDLQSSNRYPVSGRAMFFDTSGGALGATAPIGQIQWKSNDLAFCILSNDFWAVGGAPVTPGAGDVFDIDLSFPVTGWKS